MSLRATQQVHTEHKQMVIRLRKNARAMPAVSRKCQYSTLLTRELIKDLAMPGLAEIEFEPPRVTRPAARWSSDCTNVISELRKLAAGKADAYVTGWFSRMESTRPYLSVITP